MKTTKTKGLVSSSHTRLPARPARPARTSGVHMLNDRVSVRCRRSYQPGDGARAFDWLGGVVIATEPARTLGPQDRPRYVVQLDDNRRVVAFGDDVRRWSLSFDVLETLEKLAS